MSFSPCRGRARCVRRSSLLSHPVFFALGQGCDFDQNEKHTAASLEHAVDQPCAVARHPCMQHSAKGVEWYTCPMPLSTKSFHLLTYILFGLFATTAAGTVVFFAATGWRAGAPLEGAPLEEWQEPAGTGDPGGSESSQTTAVAGEK